MEKIKLHEKCMRQALAEAQKASAKAEVPVGAVIYKDGAIIGRGHNTKETDKQATGHAEINAIVEACHQQKAWRLNGASIYITLEPCAMCAGAIIQARIDNVYFGASDPKNGAFGTLMDITKIKGLNHYPNVISGVLEEECAKILKDFFVKLRK